LSGSDNNGLVVLGKPKSFDLKNCFYDIVELYQDHTVQDLLKSFMTVFSLSQKSEKTILEKLLTDYKEIGPFVCDSYFVYCIKDSNLSLHRKGYWRAGNSLDKGIDIFSLVQYVISGSAIDTFVFVAKCLNIKILNKNVTQINRFDGFEFVRYSNAYPVNYNNLLFKPFVGTFIHNYPFINDNGGVSFYLQESCFCGEIVRLFVTLQQNHDNGIRSWKYISPPCEEDMVFNRYKLQVKDNREVHIHDNIERAYRYKSDKIIDTWSGDMSICIKIDWSFLKGRIVKYVFDEDCSDSFRIGDLLIKKLSEKGVSLKIYFASEYEHSRKVVLRKGGVTIKDYMTVSEFYDYVELEHKIDLEPQKKANKSCTLTYEDFGQVGSRKPFMVEPLFRSGEFILMMAEEKVGKTIMAMDISLMLASGESFDQRLFAIKQYQTLYIDAEMSPEEAKDLIYKLSGSYKDLDKINQNFRFMDVQSHRNNLNISDTNDQAWIEEHIKGAKFIVFDNLGRLLPRGAEKSDKSWESVSNWFLSLKSRGISVFLLHHLNKRGEFRGTGKITHDANLVLSLVRPAECPRRQTKIIFNITSARHIYGEACEPFLVEYRDENNTIKRIITDVDGGQLEHVKDVRSAEEIPLKGLPPLQTVIMKYAKAPNVKFVVAGLFKKPSAAHDGTEGYPPSSVTEAFKSLWSKGLLVLRGAKKGTKYYLPENDTQKNIQSADAFPECPPE